LIYLFTYGNLINKYILPDTKMNRPTTSKAKWAGDSPRAYNRSNVMKQVLETPGIDRTTLSKATGLTNAAMTRIVQELIDAKLLKDVGQLQSDGRGRRRSGLAIEETGGYVLGISILAFNSRIVLSSISGEIIDSLPIEPTELSHYLISTNWTKHGY
jgi:hypothetical protein